MKILYLSQRFSFERAGIYADLMQALVNAGHDVTIVSCKSEPNLDYTKADMQNHCKMLYAKVGNQFGSNMIRKAFVQLKIPHAMLRCIKKHVWNEAFDLILYPTPPITFSSVVKKCKKHFDARTYLMLKDIFPQNAVDLGMIKKNSLIHKIYQKIEAALYRVSDCIGCMSEANKQYILEHYAEEVADKTTIFPNTVNCEQLTSEAKKIFRSGGEQTTFLFGGNMGKPQAVDFLLACLYELRDYPKAKFLLIGAGSETEKIKKFIQENEITNASFHESLPRAEYEAVVAQSDVGLVMLNHHFTIPNYPARTLSYLAKGLPILAATDAVTDIRVLVEENAKCGLWCESNNKKAFCAAVKSFCEMTASELEAMGQNGYQYLKEHFDVRRSVQLLNQYMN